MDLVKKYEEHSCRSFFVDDGAFGMLGVAQQRAVLSGSSARADQLA
jgi:hypothetical protein